MPGITSRRGRDHILSVEAMMCRNPQLFNFKSQGSIQSSKLLTYLADMVRPVLLLASTVFEKLPRENYKWSRLGGCGGAKPSHKESLLGAMVTR